MGEVVLIGPLEWGVVAKRHREMFGAKNHNATTLWHKFNVIANKVPPTDDTNIPAYGQLAKDVIRAIKIRMDSVGVAAGDLSIDQSIHPMASSHAAPHHSTIPKLSKQPYAEEVPQTDIPLSK
jgi:hypothetical protein